MTTFRDSDLSERIDPATTDGPYTDATDEKEPEWIADQEKVYVASAWQLMWWRFCRHRIALVSLGVITILYLVAALCEFVAPYDPDLKFRQYRHHPPSAIHIIDSTGQWRLPFVYGSLQERDPYTLRMIYTDDTSLIYPVRFFVESEPYKLWGRIELNRKFFGLEVPQEEQGIFLGGTDRLGRDMFSRIAYGARISLSIGLIGVFVSLFLGVLLGGISGYFGGLADNIIQRIIEFIRSMPSIPLWMGLSATLPPSWPVIRIYFGITLIFSLIGWTGMARVVRGRFLQLREEDFVVAARLAGANELRIILRHMVPSFLSHIIASLTLAIPGMILAETSLSFLGLGLREPAISWGVLLQEAQNVSAVAIAPWTLITPAAMVIVSVLALNFVGDGLRDAADPYAS